MYSSAKRFLRKALKATHIESPRVVNVDKNAADPKATDTLKADDTLPETTELRPNKYLNNIIELSASIPVRDWSIQAWILPPSIQRDEL